MEEVQARNDAVAPWTTLLEQAGSIELLPRGQRLVWDLSASLRTDTLSQYQAYQAALGGPGPTSAWMLADEIRARENMDPMAIVQDQIDAEVRAAGVTPGPADTTPAVPPVAAATAAANPAEPAPTTGAPMAGATNGKGP